MPKVRDSIIAFSYISAVSVFSLFHARCCGNQCNAKTVSTSANGALHVVTGHQWFSLHLNKCTKAWACFVADVEESGASRKKTFRRSMLYIPVVIHFRQKKISQETWRFGHKGLVPYFAGGVFCKGADTSVGGISGKWEVGGGDTSVRGGICGNDTSVGEVTDHRWGVGGGERRILLEPEPWPTPSPLGWIWKWREVMKHSLYWMQFSFSLLRISLKWR